ncbi:hypothetical protein D5086_015231 [Populus alba]|uniref:Uncharacterized protein n=1 Tax=Populus alba TaxID=43335 RepID=A0ACC4C0H2_POPAL
MHLDLHFPSQANLHSVNKKPGPALFKNYKNLKILNLERDFLSPSSNLLLDINFENKSLALAFRQVFAFCRDLKLENTLLDGTSAPRLKICDFGYSKSSVLHSQPKSTVGTPAYIAPEVLSRKEYDGKIADVWSCGVTLYVMLVGAYPFEDPEDSRNFRKTIQRILSVHYSIPDYVRVSKECKHLLSRIFVADPEKRITIPEIKTHSWFLRSFPVELKEEKDGSLQINDRNEESQSIEEILAIIQEARKPAEGHKNGGHFFGGSMDLDDIDSDADIDDVETSGDFVCAL